MLSYVVVSGACAIIATGLNVYCVIVIVRSKKLSSPRHMTIFSLLLGHSLQGLFVIPCYAAKKSGFYKRTVICDIFRFSYLLTNYWCCLSVLAISIDRLIGIQYPLQYKAWVTTKRMSRVLIGTWMYVFCLCLVPFAPSKSTSCHYNPQKQWVIVMLVVNTLLPFILIMVSYTLIFRQIRIVMIGKEKRDKLTKRKITVESKRIKMTFFLVGTYVLCWGPSLIYYLLMSLCPEGCFASSYIDSRAEEIIGFSIKLLTFVDGIIGPLIYCCTSKSFHVLRKKALDSFRKKWAFGKSKDKVKHILKDESHSKTASPNRMGKHSVEELDMEDIVLHTLSNQKEISLDSHSLEKKDKLLKRRSTCFF